MRRLILIALSLFLAVSATNAQLTISNVGGGFGGAAGGACSQYTTFLARTSGLDATHQSAYQTMICGMVTDGTWSQLEALYILATNTTTTANLNLTSTSYTLSVPSGCNQGAPTFTADQGYTGNGSAKCLDTGFIPSSNCVVCGQDSVSLGIYVQTSRTTSCGCVEMGAAISGVRWLTNDVDATTMSSPLNDLAFTTGSNANAQGTYVATRSASNSSFVYKNGSTTPIVSTSDASTGTVSSSVAILALGLGSGTISNPSSDQVSAAFIGKGLSAADAVALNNRINTYMASLSTPVNVY